MNLETSLFLLNQMKVPKHYYKLDFVFTYNTRLKYNRQSQSMANFLNDPCIEMPFFLVPASIRFFSSVLILISSSTKSRRHSTFAFVISVNSNEMN